MHNRLESLDWLRGMMALSIMLFHLGMFGFLGGPHDSSTLLGKLGIYGVSIFFILSGLSMAIGYDKYIKDLHSSALFFIRRLFRIWPLLWLAVALVAIPAYMAGKPYSIALIGLNITTLFGFSFPHLYMNMGAWSIGNEMVYYALTPLLIAAYHHKLWLGNAVTTLTAIIGVFFAFILLTPTESLDTQWRTYINPFNNLFLYCSGLAIYYNFKNINISGRLTLPVFGFLTLLFILYPASGDQISIVTGLNRVALSIISILIVFAFYKFPLSLPNILGKPLEQLGIATYGVYLLHPIIIQWTQKAFNALGIQVPHLFVLFVVVTTIGVALLSFRYLESPLIKAGKNLTRVLQNRFQLSERPA